MEEVLVREIRDPFRNEKQIDPIEINLYSRLIKKKNIKNDDNEIAKDLYDQLIDNKEEINNN